MKTKAFGLCVCMLLCVLTTFRAMAQQPANEKYKGPAVQIAAGSTIVYTYKIFQAPNEMYGYDIFRDGKIIFHQGASPLQSNNNLPALSKKEHADQAALLTIEKIKKYQPGALTQEELRKISLQ